MIMGIDICLGGGYNKDGEIVDYKDEEFMYPAPSLSYSKI